jgi:nitrate/TMAO reductase-like tetraheme cytochrome c subunit
LCPLCLILEGQAKVVLKFHCPDCIIYMSLPKKMRRKSQ